MTAILSEYEGCDVMIRKEIELQSCMNTVLWAEEHDFPVNGYVYSDILKFPG